VKAIMTKRAERSLERIMRWWHESADQPGLFTRELLDAIHMLETTRSPGSPYRTRGHPKAKRILLRKSSCHVYFEVDEARQIIEILELWSAQRGRSPKL